MVHGYFELNRKLSYSLRNTSAGMYPDFVSHLKPYQDLLRNPICRLGLERLESSASPGSVPLTMNTLSSYDYLLRSEHCRLYHKLPTIHLQGPVCVFCKPLQIQSLQQLVATRSHSKWRR